MHEANRKFWKMCEVKYEKYFHGPNAIVECGSHNVNGVVREHFKDFVEYIGVDWRAGECVDHVSLIHDLPWKERFDTLISSSLLEHDPYWVETVVKMVELTKSSGGMFLSWGGMLNVIHCEEHACDGLFHPLSPQKVSIVLERLGVYIHEFGYETNFGGGPGEVYLVAFKNKEFALGDRSVEEFLPEDKLDLTEDEENRFRALNTQK
jgi:hypothetical protein